MTPMRVTFKDEIGNDRRGILVGFSEGEAVVAINSPDGGRFMFVDVAELRHSEAIR